MDNKQIYTTENSNPWIGLDSYKEGQTLYGRSREIQDLSMAVFYNRHTVVYGRSGIGKSSLLHAGIFPEARRRGCLPISIRFDHSVQMGYREQLIRSIVDAVIANGGEVKDLTGKDTKPYSLWEFFHCYQLKRGEETITPLIVIDQFEEIFTLGRNQQQVKDFFEELADLLNDIKPAYLQTTSEQVDQDSSGSLFDNLNIQISDDRYEQEMPFHLVFVLREDYLSYLERYSLRIPSLKQNRFGLLPITYLQAMEIITKPREGLVTKEVADTIIRHIVTENDITDETPVDSAILSLFLNRLYEKKSDASAITRQLVNDYGNALLEDFYAEIVNPQDRRTIHYLEDTLINSDGHRENVSLESLYRNDHIKQSVIEILEHNHLLRIFSYGDVQRVEFAHDVLCPIIMRCRTQRQYAERTRRTKRVGLGAFFSLVLLLFGGMYIIAERLDKKEALARQQEQLSEMEVALIEKGTQKMLDNHDIYGAIQLLINSIDSRESIPSPTTARKEKMLRQSLDSLLQSDSTKVASIHYRMHWIGGQCVISKSKRICGVLDEANMGVIILDTQTGTIIQTFSLNKSFADSQNIYNYNYSKNEADLYLYTKPEENELTSTAFPLLSHEHNPKLIITDIHPNDTRCLLVANDTVLLDCFIYTGDDKYLVSSGEFGATRLCIHDIYSKISEAAYTASGDSIVVLLSDSTILLYSALSGNRVYDETASLHTLKEACKRRCDMYEYYDNPNGDGIIGYPAVIELTDYTRLSHYMCDEYILSLSSTKELGFRNRITSDTIWTIYQSDVMQEKQMREYLDSLQLSTELKRLQRTYYEDNFEVGNRYLCPLAINPQSDRVAVLLLTDGTNRSDDLYGLYSHNGAIFYHTKIPYEVHSLHFTEDDQYLVVNAGEETQEVIYLPPLETLVDSCKNMFFDWQMTEEERYQTYIHMND